MEIKVLAAVFLTLLGVAVAMGQGNLSVEDVTDMGELMSRFQENLQKVSDAGGGFLDAIRGGETMKPANTSLNGSFTASTRHLSIRLRDAVDTVDISGNNVSVSIAGLETNPDDASIVLRNYTGRLTVDGNLSIDGSAAAVSVDEVSFASDSSKDVDIYVDDLTSVRIDPLPRTTFSFSRVEGEFSSSGTFELTNGTAALESFTGLFEKNGESYTLEGKVNKAVLEEGNTRTEIGAD